MAFADAPRVASGYVSEDYLYGATTQDLMESVPALAWPESVRTYNAMRFDPQIQGVLSAYTLPLMSADYLINPKGCRDEVVKLCAGAYGMTILGDNDGPGPFVRRGVQWDQHLRLALLMLPFGHMPFAFSGDIEGTPRRYRLKVLSERLPQTLSKIEVDRQGELDKVWQWGEKQPMDARAMLWYVHNREGANWVGQSMLRSAYAPWLIKHEMWRVMATSSRRFGMGIPSVEAPPGGTDGQVQEAARLASAMRVGDTAGMGLPSGFTAKIVGMTGSVPDTLGWIRYLDQQIAQSVLASVLTLDATPNGSRALGDTLVNLLKMSWLATAKEIIYPANHLLAKLVDWNFGENEPVPSIQVTNLNRPEITAEAVQQLMAAGAITYDPKLEAAIRENYQLPERDEDYVPPAPPQIGPAPADPPEGDPAGVGKTTTTTTAPAIDPAGV